MLRLTGKISYHRKGNEFLSCKREDVESNQKMISFSLSVTSNHTEQMHVDFIFHCYNI